MRVRFLRSFDRSLKGLEDPQAVDEAVERLLEYFGKGHRPEGLGLKFLGRSYWEVRVGLKVRILFHVERDLLTLILVGSHDAIQRYLRRA